MEDLRGIAEESFPNFLTNSLLGNSGILENDTLSSNLGLPVAVSTLARNGYSTDNRYSDIQASYLVEEKFSVPSESSLSSQSEAEPRKKLQLSFQGDETVWIARNPPGFAFAEFEDPRDVEDAVRGLDGKVICGSWARVELSTGKPWSSYFDRPLPDIPLIPVIDAMSMVKRDIMLMIVIAIASEEASHCLDHIRDSDVGSTLTYEAGAGEGDDDIDDEEFYDDHLEAYFEQLAIPGMIYEDLEGQEPPEKDFKLPTSDTGQECTREDVLVKTITATHAKFNPDYFHDKNASKSDFDLTDPLKLEAGSPHQNKLLASDSEIVLPKNRCLDIETPKVSNQKNTNIASLKSISDNEINSTDTLRSPTSERRTCERYEYIEKSKDQTDLPQSVVYQNEEGRWVTDLAYYTSFNEEQDLNMSLTDEMNEDFRSGSEALDLIAQDEEEFNKEHQFMQEENIDAQNTSLALGDTSWGTSINYNLLRKSLSTSDLDKDDASYLRLSLGEFFAQRSEALGCLGGGYNVKRPSFGYFIRSPEKREPVALIRKSDLSRSNLEKEMAHLNHDLFSGDLKEQSKAQLSEGSITLHAEELENISQVDENDVTLTASKDKTEDTFFMNSKPQRCKGKLLDGGDSVLRISTIASAIENASVSTDPSQFAAMIKALSNNIQEDDKQKDCSIVSHFLPNDLEKSNGSSTFDMEKYLKKTEVSRCEGGLQNFSRADGSIWDLYLPKERTTEDIHTVDLGATTRCVRESEENTAAICYGENGESESQESLRSINTSNSVLTNIRENESAVVDMKTYSIDDKFPDIGNSEKATSMSIPTSNSYSLVRTPRIASLWLSKECEEMQSNRENQRENEYVSETSSEKHVTFGKHSLISPKNVDLKNPSPEHGACGSEDGQDSFRPSTSPLSHSSPSEISGTSLSGCALETFGSAAHHQKSPSESGLSQLMCPQAGLSRLTYVSEQGSTCPTTALDYGPEDHKSDIISELSTTIIRASPIPSEEQREKGSFQSRGKGASSCIIQKSSDTEKVTETTSLSNTPEDVKPDLRLSKDLSSQSGDLSETTAVSLTSDPDKLDEISLVHLSKSRLRHPAVSAIPCLPMSHQASVNESERVTSKDTSTTDTTLSGQAPHQTASEDQCVPVPSSVACGSVPEMQSVPTAVPALSARHSFTTASFAQQYLGTLPAAGNVALPQCCADSTTVCGFSGSCPYPAIIGDNVQSSVAMDICLGQNISSGLMGTSSFYNPYFNVLHQNLLTTAKPFPVQSLGANCGIEPGDSGMMSGFGNVRVPEELKFPHACCVGIASQTHLSVLNPTARWLQVSIRVLSVSINGEKVDLSAYPCLVFKNKVIIRPHATEEIKVLFIPSNPGLFRCIFSVASWPFTADAETVVQAEALASRVILTAIAETPVIEVETEKEDVLDFGDLTYGGWKALPLKLINKTHATVPIRLIINANAIAWRCFTFSKEPVHASMTAAPYADVIAQLAAPSVINHMMPASYPGQTMHLFASVASLTKQQLPLKNAGNIDVYLDIKIPNQGSHFSVDPETLFLKPGEEHEVIISFTPKDLKAYEERILKIFVQPFGPQYEVMLKGEVVSSANKPPPSGSCCSYIPSILSNKQFLAWGGVPLGRTQLQRLALRNNSTSTAQHLRLLIRGQDQDCFQLQHTFGSEERLTNNCEIKIRPKEDINISVLFAPTRLSCMLAKLEIKQLGIRSQPGIKFTIPLSGYGGTSNLILEDVKKLSDSYMVTLNDLIPGKESRIVFSIRNTGSRAAFVKAVGFKDSQKKVFLDPQVFRIFPDKFVLKENTQENVTIIYNPSSRESSYKTATELSTVYFFGGDEISRQQYRRALLHKPRILEQILPENSVLQNINFAEAFQDELLVTEVYDLPQRPNDVQLFYGNMRKIILSIIGEFRDCISSREFLHSSKESKSESDSLRKHGGNVSLDVLPVKGPQSSPPLSQAVYSPQDKSSSEEMWTVQPEHLILVAPTTCDLAKTGRFQILNNSVRLLKFELYWPAHCLTVTPQHGFIEPESKLQILVSPNSTLSTKHSIFPWSGLIYIHCDNGQKKIVKVQIREDLTQEELLTPLASSSFGISSRVTEPSASHLVKPMTKPPSTKVEIRNKTVTFPTVEPGETSENYLELENHGNTEVKWRLSSLAPPYVKGVDESGDVFRATYAAFRCSPISGILESHGIQKVSITFLPRDKGDYAQFWDVECHPFKEPHMKHTLRFQLSGRSIKAENELENSCISTNTLIKIDNLVKPRRQAASEASLIHGQLDLTHRGVYAPEDVYRFLPTRVGESRTLKVNLRNNSFITHSLKFLSPREPFYVKHSKYSLRAQHYINMPVQFKPKSVGKFEALLVIQMDECKSVAIRLIGEALEKI
ncbi:Centrosomal protein of 192 kDa [Pteropus alecto]|uniref:Centrosomal protein of 192 kDa n=1 Tax=Pteropus alecto TaxID=9402 RepID=L5KW54_PTEAL|nr:Centrosomal protein of 192 kDa [Pteropus alecto]